MTIEEKIEEIRTCRALYDRKDYNHTYLYYISVAKWPSLFHWHCSRPMYKLHIIQSITVCPHVARNTQYAPEYVCRNENCKYHITKC